MKAIFEQFGNQAAEQAKAEKAYERLYFYLNRAKLTLERLAAIEGKTPYIAADQKEINRFEVWFGTIEQYDTHISHVKDLICAIHQRFEDDNIILYYDVCKKNKDCFAFVECDDIYRRILKIHLCNEFFATNDDRCNTKLGTILHELTHLVGFTGDIAYGEKDCRNMNKTFSIFNADSYEMYLESFRNM